MAAARALIEADGLDTVSMRKVAAEVGLAPTAIYWHVGSREDLLNAVLDEMIAELPPIAARGRTAQKRLASVARSLRDQVRATTLTQQLAAELGRAAELSFPAQIVLARELQAAGLKGEDAAMAARAVLFVVGGFILLEDNFAHREPGAKTTQDLWSGVADDGIEPAIHAAMSRPADTDALFDYAVSRLLSSILTSV